MLDTKADRYVKSCSIDARLPAGYYLANRHSSRLAMQRVFVAIPLPPTASRLMFDAISRVNRPNLRWIAPEYAHITLAFLGSVDDKQLHLVLTALAKVTMLPFRLVLTAVESFPSRRNSRVLAIAVRPSEHLTDLFHSVRTELLPYFPDLRRSFRPHVTLARSRGRSKLNLERKELESLEDPLPVTFDVSHFNLYSSRTASDRAYYTVLQSFAL